VSFCLYCPYILSSCVKFCITDLFIMLQSTCKFCHRNQLRETWHFSYRHKWNYLCLYCEAIWYFDSKEHFGKVWKVCTPSLTTPFVFLFFKPLVAVVDCSGHTVLYWDNWMSIQVTRFWASATVSMKYSLFWNVMQCWLVVSFWCFGTTYQSHLQGIGRWD